jgi:cardiolipin synthase A/B
MQTLAVNLGLPAPVTFQDLCLHQDGPMALERLLAVLLEARHTLEVSSFLVGRDAVGSAVTALLARRAREGVRVRLMVDGLGRYLGGVPNLHPLRTAGVELAFFVPPWSAPFRGRGNLRNHRKMAIADGEWLWMGGRNLAAEYFVGPAPHGRRERPWTDLSFDVRGALVGDAHAQFERDWAEALGSPLPVRPARVAAPAADPGAPIAQFLPSGPDQARDTLYELLIDACFTARTRIVAATPYFVPDQALLMAFTLAARRGVIVDLLLPRRSNHRLADLARPQAVREMMEAGARVWLTPQMLHAKLVIVDGTVALTGSLNLDSRSLFLNYEMMVAFYDPATVERFTAWAEGVRAGAVLQQPQRVRALREVGEGLLRWLTFQL